MLKMMRGGPRAIALVISADQTSLYNIFTSAGSPTNAVAVMVTVNSGKILKAGITTGSGWIAGSTITLINNGTIAGIGGGDTAGVFGLGGFATSTTLSAGENGRDGGDAVTMSWDLTIDNTNGSVFGGGGQGGGGGASAVANPPGGNGGTPGGGGGGGRGYNNALGGDKGSDSGLTFLQVPTDGADGSSSGAGLGGVGATCSPLTFTGRGGDAGDGGDWGQDGQDGDAGSAGPVNTAGGGKGHAGNSVRKNGKTLTWQGGNNSTQVKGPQT